MSGGVDSSVAAGLLKARGHAVIGVMLRLWSEEGREGSNRCCTPASMELARRAAAKLEIPFYVLDVKESFRKVVVESFLDGYGRGLTPNPCLECNRQIRWTVLLEHAMALGADKLATGHYARVRQTTENQSELLWGTDPTKDQSYVLHVLTQAQLSRAVFPVGAYTKVEVRRLAEEFELPAATRRDSQDLCFLAGGDYRGFIRRNRPEILREGKIVSVGGVVVGQHGGLADYTVGQRKGLPIRSSVPMYVVRKEFTTNTLVVGQAGDLGSYELTTGPVNWISGQPRTAPFAATVKTRYSARHAEAIVSPLEGGARVRVSFREQQRDLTPGQAAVFYEGESVIGGGQIL
jgi:tRNA-specific 2-thiouridylase